MKRNHKLSKLYKELLEAKNEIDASIIRDEIHEIERAQRQHERHGLLPSQRGGLGFSGFAAVDNHYRWEDWN